MWAKCIKLSSNVFNASWEGKGGGSKEPLKYSATLCLWKDDLCKPKMFRKMEMLIYLHTLLTSPINRNTYKTNAPFFTTTTKKKTLSRVYGRMWLSVYSQRNSTSKLSNRSVERKWGISAIPKSPSILDIRICQEQSIPSPRPPSISRTGRP